jgi:Bacterial Ig-like domain/RTX calcium-binding nonapeptide repeat (4 copies)
VGSAVKLLDGSTQIGSATASASGGWTITAPVLGQGTHAIATTATDAAGNTSAPSAALSVNIDTTAPSSPAFNGLTANSNFSATLAGTAEASSIVTVFDLSTQLGTATAGGTGVWSFKTGALSDTLHVFTASATDQAGTAGGISGSAQFGSSAADIFTSASGNDTLMGRGGADTFSFMANFANDIISDFAATGAGHDVINFHANAVLNNYTSVLSHAAQSGSSVMISQDVGNTLILRNVTLGSLNTSAFTFV